MKRAVKLTEEEDLTLQQLSVNHKHRDIRTRAAGIMLLGSGISPKEIATRLGCTWQSVYNWANAWKKKGICGLLIGHKGGRHYALSDAMIATATEAARAESMTLKQIGQRIEEVHGEPLPCRLDTLGAALKRAGFSYKRGRYSLKKNATSKSSP